jgi:DNA-binding NarL/FixJ family response regulator
VKCAWPWESGTRGADPAEGATNREIAEALFLSPHTIKEHTSTLYRKLGARNRADAVHRAQRLGLQR